MAENADKKTPLPGAPPVQDETHYPPPPPGPPPSQARPQQPPSETPHPDPTIPKYDSAHPQYTPSSVEEDIYGATPTEEKPPVFSATGTAAPTAQEPPAAKVSWGQRLAGWGTKAAAPLNALAAKVGSETFLPTTMDKECEKAARILRSFCKDGIYSEEAPQTAPSQTGAPATTTTATTADPSKAPTDSHTADAAKAKAKSRVLLTIPSKVIARAQGLAIFTTVRAGFHVTGASGSGVLVARLPDGSWSPPSGIQVHSVGAGFVIGLDIYDCVVVINTKEALKAFTNTRMSLGSDLAVTAGPWGAGGALEWGVPTGKGKEKEGPPPALPPRNPSPAPPAVTPPPAADSHSQQPPQFAPPPTEAVDDSERLDAKGRDSSKNRKPSPGGFRDTLTKPVYSYVKSRGFYAGVQIDGTVVTERKDANAAFYGERVPVDQILKGEVPLVPSHASWPATVRGLFDVLKGAEGWHGQEQRDSTADVTTGVQGMHLGQGSAPTTTSSFPPPPPGPPPGSKAAEAAAEASAAREELAAPPPEYTNPTGVPDDLPPAYEDDGQARPGVGDTKSGPPPSGH
ncbi:hypothetical protein GQ53DRAFT_696673 [Thozetella sp. PMI_491]|nr:hypothetical protein GQ53DRAFT_696673 [Thozetella sp. PMI_491]